MTKQFKESSLIFWFFALVLGFCVAPMGFGQSDQAQAAWETYLEYRDKLDNAKTVDDVVAYFVKERADEVKQTPEEERTMMFDMMKMMSEGMSDFEVLSEEWDGDTKVVFKVTGKQEQEGAEASIFEGKIDMIKETDGWKVGKESFSIKSDE